MSFFPLLLYTYTIKYRTANQTRHFPDHAEVYWNVTGNDWIFPIDKVTATVTLPTGGAIQDTAVFTGQRGSQASDATREIITDNAAKFETTKPLRSRGGMTVAVKFQSGLVPRPPKIQYYSGIDSFQSNMQLDANGELSVIERFALTVTETDPVKNGLIREFDRSGPTRAANSVRFSEVKVTRNGRPIDAAYYDNRGEGSIYLGDRGKAIRAGKYTYEISYRISRQVNFGQDADTFSWYALPKGLSDLPIAKASARITVPGSGVTSDFVGGKDAATSRGFVNITIGHNAFTYDFAPPVRKYGQAPFTLTLPKGLVEQPTSDQRLDYLWQDYSHLFIGFFMMALVGLYYLLPWMFVGRDPKPGPVVPSWEPPEGISPALVSYIEHEGLNNKGRNAMSAALINLGVRGLITMYGFDDDLTVKRRDMKKHKGLPVGEAALLGKLHRQGLTFNRTNAAKVKRLSTAFSNAMTTEHRAVYFSKNRAWSIWGIILSLGAVMTYMFYDSNFTGRIFQNIVPLLILSVVMFFLLGAGLRAVRNLFTTPKISSRVQSIVAIAVLGFLLFNLVSILALDSIYRIFLVDIDIALPILGIIGLNVLFWFLMGAPTKLGRDVMDKIAGLRLYLKMAEADRMNMAGAPNMNPQHFETLLPYAVALKLEKPWAESFDRWLNQPSTNAGGKRVYNSDWNRDWSDRGFDSSLNFGNSVASGFASAVPAPSRSSGGGSSRSSSGFSGGGSSGGGGGGGGGGGW